MPRNPSKPWEPPNPGETKPGDLLRIKSFRPFSPYGGRSYLSASKRNPGWLYVTYVRLLSLTNPAKEQFQGSLILPLVGGGYAEYSAAISLPREATMFCPKKIPDEVALWAVKKRLDIS